MTNLHSILKRRESFVFSSSYVWVWELGQKEGWAPKNWCFWIVELEKTLESPLDCKEIKPVNPKGNQPWIFIGRTDAEAEAPVLWPPDVKNQLIGKDSDTGKDWYWEGGEEGDRGWDCWIASRTQWTWVWANSWRWWRMGKPGMLQCMGSQRVRHNLVTEQQVESHAEEWHCWTVSLRMTLGAVLTGDCREVW